MENQSIIDVIRADINIVPEMTVSLDRCPRCNHFRPDLSVRRLRQPSLLYWDVWATCPTTL